MIPEVLPYNNYTGDGATTQFDFDFYIEDSSQLNVEHTDENNVTYTLEENIDYTINEVGNENGSYITFPIAGSTYSVLASGEVISLQLTLPISQESEYGKSTEMDFKSLEYSFDYLTRICQIINRQMDRAVKIKEGSDTTPDELLKEIDEQVQTAQNYSSEASASATSAYNSAVSAGDDATAAAQTLAELQDLYDTASEDITAKHTAAVTAVETAQSTAVTAIETEYTSDSEALQDLYDTASEDITAKHTAAVNDIETAQTTAITAIDTRKATAVAEVTETYTTAMETIETQVDNAQIWVEGTDEEVAALGGEHSAKVWADLYSESANVSLSNLSEIGQAVIDNKADIDLTNAEPSSEFKAASVQWGLPDYTAGVSFSSEYTVPQPGFIICCIIGTSTSRQVYINGTLAASTVPNTSYYDSSSCSFPVDTDDVVTASTYSSPVLITYYPLKGV